jgi:hypothetical protein
MSWCPSGPLLRILVCERFSTSDTLTMQQKRQFWQCHGIGLDVRHAVTLPESAISLQKKSNSLRKGAGENDSLKWGLAEMVLWSVRGPSHFSVFFAVQFCALWGGKKGGESYPPDPLFLFIKEIIYWVQRK